MERVKTMRSRNHITLVEVIKKEMQKSSFPVLVILFVCVYVVAFILTWIVPRLLTGAHGMLVHFTFPLIPASFVTSAVIITAINAIRRVTKIIEYDIIKPINQIVESMAHSLSNGQLKIEQSKSHIQEIRSLQESFLKISSIIDAQLEELKAQLNEIKQHKQDLEASYNREIKFKHVLQAIMEIMDEYLKGTKIEQMYQFMLEKTISSIPKAQGGNILLKNGDEYTFVAAVGYDLKELSKATFSREEIEIWTKGKDQSIIGQNDINAIGLSPDDSRFEILK